MRKITVFAAAVLIILLIGCGEMPVKSDDLPDEAQPVQLAEAISVPEEPMPQPSLLPTPEPEPEPTPEPTPEPCPLTDEEYRLLAELMTCEAQVVVWDGEKWGVSPYCRIAAVAWTALNRLDAGDYGDTLEKVIKAPHQFAWKPGIEPPDWMEYLARDVAEAWWAEKQTGQSIGRVIPADYLWFHGDGRENYFRNQYQGGTTWDWSLPDPYEEWMT